MERHYDSRDEILPDGSARHVSSLRLRCGGPPDAATANNEVIEFLRSVTDGLPKRPRVTAVTVDVGPSGGDCDVNVTVVMEEAYNNVANQG